MHKMHKMFTTTLKPKVSHKINWTYCQIH